MNKPVYIVAASRDNDNGCFIDVTYSVWGNKSNIHFVRKRNNTKPLQVLYNEILNSQEFKGSYVIFCHDDVYIDSYLNVQRINDVFECTKFSIIGLAGSEKLSLTRPCLWHLNQGKHGVVNHSTSENNIMVFSSNFGNTPNKTLVVDGLFMAVDVDKCVETGTFFDEKCPSGFHFYDLDFCLTAHKNGLKCGVYPFSVVHKSHGLKEYDPVFLSGQDYFINKWSR